MTSTLSHVALLVPSVDASARFLNSHGIATGEPESFDSEGTKEIYVGSYDQQRGLLLLLEAISAGPYQRAMEKRGPSLHHIALDVRDITAFTEKAQSSGWKLHPVSEDTMAYKTAWLFLEGISTLIEVHQKKELSQKPSKISKVHLPLQQSQMPLFQGIGLGEVITPDNEVLLVIDGHQFSFQSIASGQS